MIGKFFLFLIGFTFVVTSISTIILYINLLSFGYTFKEYIYYVIKTPELYYLIFGFILIGISMKKKGRN